MTYAINVHRSALPADQLQAELDTLVNAEILFRKREDISIDPPVSTFQKSLSKTVDH